jgi:hypothetical protein
MSAWWVLVVVSCCAALVAFFLIYVSIRLTGEMFAADPYCATPTGHVLQTIEEIHTGLLAGGAAGLLSLFCAFVTRRSASSSTRGARRTSSALLILSSLALVGSFCGYKIASQSDCFG